MRQINVGSLCSGYGGLDMAVEALIPGAAPVWFAETAPGPSRILAHHYPDVPNLGDLTTTDWYDAEPIDILTAGWPCQPWSAAGKRKGIHDERAIWPQVERAIRELRPGLVLLENVGRIASVGELGRAVGSLSEIGYDARWRCLRASDVGAPHRRERCFIVAEDTTHVGYEWGGSTWGWWAGPADRRDETAADAGQAAADAVGGSGDRRSDQPQRGTQGRTAPRWDSGRGRGGHAADGGEGGGQAAADAGHHGRLRGAEQDGVAVEPELQTPLGDDADRRHVGPAGDHRSGRGGGDAGTVGTGDAVADPGSARLGEHTGEPSAEEARPQGGDEPADHRGLRPDTDWGPYRPAVERWEHLLRREAPEPTEPGHRTGQRLSPRFVEWMMGLPDGWVTDVPGLTRNDQLKALGNGVVPQQAIAAYAWLLGLDVAAVFPEAAVEGALLPTPVTAYTATSVEAWRKRRPAGNGATRKTVGDLGLVAGMLAPSENASVTDSTTSEASA